MTSRSLTTSKSLKRLGSIYTIPDYHYSAFATENDWNVAKRGIRLCLQLIHSDALKDIVIPKDKSSDQNDLYWLSDMDPDKVESDSASSVHAFMNALVGYGQGNRGVHPSICHADFSPLLNGAHLIHTREGRSGPSAQRTRCRRPARVRCERVPGAHERPLDGAGNRHRRKSRRHDKGGSQFKTTFLYQSAALSIVAILSIPSFYTVRVFRLMLVFWLPVSASCL
jgi:hypothetical protein